MERIDTIVIGGGQAGLAMSRCLSERAVEHVVLERGRVGERWRSERWESLRLLTPRRLSRLSGWAGDDQHPAGFMTRDEVVQYLAGYAAEAGVPLRSGVGVISVERDGDGYRVDTTSGSWHGARVVIATGESQDAFVPTLSRDLPGWIHQVLPTRYRRPDELPEGKVLVVGASATGVQLAQEIHASGRPVTLSVGRHTRLPRRYRGRDILDWFLDMGILDQSADSVANLSASRDQPSMQLVGSADHATLDLRVLQDQGISLVGRTEGASGTRLFFADELVETIAAAELKLASLRRRIDDHVRRHDLGGSVASPDPFLPVPMPDAPARLDLAAEGIRTVLWATGFRRSYPWLRVPVLNASGEIRHRGGITAAAGLYVLGLNFMRRRSSSFLMGVAHDAADLADHMVRSAAGRSAERAVA